MQYKIPVQIENEDPIFLGLGLKQLTVIMIGGGIAYSLFTSLAPKIGIEIAAIPSILIVILAILIAVFKHSEMTFIPFILSFIRFHTNVKKRVWVKGVDSFQPMDLGYVTTEQQVQKEKIDFESKINKIKNIDDKLKKI